MNDQQAGPSEQEERRQLARASEGQAGSLLRLRDVQALNRSFRRLAEVQEALLDQMADLQEERRAPTRWLAPLLGFGGIVFGLGLGVLGLAWYRRMEPAEPIQVHQPAPEIRLDSPPVTVNLPEDAVTRETMEAFLGELHEVRAARAEDRREIARLRQQLFDQEEQSMQRLQQLGALADGIAGDPRTASPERLSAFPAASPPPAAERKAEPAAEAGPTAAADPWLGTLNGLIGMDGYPQYQFKQATRVMGLPQLEDVILLEGDPGGSWNGVLHAERAEFELHKMASTLVVRFYDGYRVREGQRLALEPEGSRLDLGGVNVDAWLRHFPALAGGAASAGGSEPGGAAVRADEVQVALDEFLAVRRSYGYYRLTALGGVDGNELRMVQINWFDSGGHLVKTLEADSLEVKLHPGDSVELLLRNGSILEGGRRKPFYEDRYRIYLPRQSREEWLGSGIPLVDLGA